MNGYAFKAWFGEILDKLPEGSTIVMDNASYQNVKQDEIPTTSQKKAAIVQWLTKKGVEVNETYLKVELLEEVNRIRGQYERYAINELALASSMGVLRLPPSNWYGVR